MNVILVIASKQIHDSYLFEHVLALVGNLLCV